MEYLLIFDFYLLVAIGIGLIAGVITKVLYALAERERKKQSLSRHSPTAPFTQGSLGNHRHERPEWLEMIKNEYAEDDYDVYCSVECMSAFYGLTRDRSEKA